MKRIPNRVYDFIDSTPTDVFGRAVKKGHVGIEIEVEGHNLPIGLPKYWKGIADGSLRGESMEYVLTSPIDRAKVREALDILSQAFIDHGTRVNESYRTSVHVHLNVQERSFREIFNQATLWMIFEGLLIQYCGKDRIGNLFCLTANDAENIIDCIRTDLVTGNFVTLADEQAMKYSAMNFATIMKYGSLEFRTMRGTTDPELIETWVSMLLAMYDSAQKYKDPQEIVQQFSANGAGKFLFETFGYRLGNILTQYPNWEMILQSGVRNAQLIAYAIPGWSRPPKKEAEETKEFKILYNLDNNNNERMVMAPAMNLREAIVRQNVDNRNRARDGAAAWADRDRIIIDDLAEREVHPGPPIDFNEDL